MEILGSFVVNYGIREGVRFYLFMNVVLKSDVVIKGEM